MIKVYYHYDCFTWKIYFKSFESYEDFKYWYSKHYTKVRINDIEEE